MSADAMWWAGVILFGLGFVYLMMANAAVRQAERERAAMREEIRRSHAAFDEFAETWSYGAHAEAIDALKSFQKEFLGEE